MQYTHLLRALRLARHPRPVHPAGHVHGVAPDVVLRLPRADHPGHHGTHVQADPQHERVVGVLVDALQLLAQPENKLDELREKRLGAEAAVILLVRDPVLCLTI